MNLKPRVWDLKTSSGPIDPKDLPNHKSITLIPFFTKKTLFDPESKGKSNEFLKHLNKHLSRDLEPKNQLWAIWTQKTYQAISAEPWIQYLQTRPHLMQNVKANKIFSPNIRIYLQLQVWDLKKSFEPIGSKILSKP